MNCTGCGRRNERGSKFCNGCGRPIAVCELPSRPRESSEIKNAKAVAFFAVMVVLSLVLLRVDLHPTIFGPFFGCALFVSAAAWGLSKALPDGWLDMKRTIALAVVLSLGLVGYIQFG